MFSCSPNKSTCPLGANKHGFSSVLGRKCVEVFNTAQKHYLHPGKISSEMHYTAAHISALVLSYPVAVLGDCLKPDTAES